MRSLVLASLLGGFLVVLAPSRAEACSPIPPGISATIPEAGATYPANAPVLLQGGGFDATKIAVTVDGKVATLAPAPVTGNIYGAFTISPTPMPGQSVSLKGKVCDGSGGPFSCDLDLSYTTGPADLAAPGVLTEVSFDVHDYDDFKSSGGDCQSNSDLALHVRLKATASAAGSQEYWRVTVYDASNDGPPLFARVLGRSGDSGEGELRLLASDFDGAALPSGVCLAVSSFDLVGNETPPVSQCSPCRYRKDAPGGQKPFTLPQEPVWTSADVVPGGSCDTTGQGGAGGSGGTSAGGQAGQSGQGGTPAAGTAGTSAAGTSAAGQAGTAGSGAGGSGNPASNGIDSESSGGCAVASGASGWAGLWPLLGLLVARVRRRR